MKVKKILVQVDSSESSLSRLETGFNLARNLGASIAALCTVPHNTSTIKAGTRQGSWYLGEDVMEKQRKMSTAATDEVHEVCERLAKTSGVQLDWVQQEGSIIDTTCQEIKYHDLLLMGKPDALDEPQLYASDLNSILLSCGKPVLVVPTATSYYANGVDSIVVAWDESREAVQALQHAMPFLEDASTVMLASAYKNKGRSAVVDEQLARLVAYLAAHDVSASSHLLEKGSVSMGERLLDFAETSGTDMLVMGAYGHSRFREIVLGGATRHMLHHASMPVLFGH